MIIDDCIFANMQNVFNDYVSKVITITNSTLYNMTERAIYMKGTSAVILTVENCTLVDLGKTPFESRATNGNLYYKNNISACFVTSSPNLAYKMNVKEFSGNYAAAVTEDGQLAVVNIHNKAVDTNNFPDAWTDTSKTVAELFEDAANDNFKLKMDAQVGDPRWYKNAQ